MFKIFTRKKIEKKNPKKMKLAVRMSSLR